MRPRIPRTNTVQPGSIRNLLSDKPRYDRASALGYDAENPFFHATRYAGGDTSDPFSMGITEFDLDLSDVGIHMGTLDQATNRLTQTTDANRKQMANDLINSGASEAEIEAFYDDYATAYKYGPESNIMPLITRANNPLLMEDVGDWNNAYNVAEHLRDLDVLRVVGGTKFKDELFDIKNSYEAGDPWLQSQDNLDALDEIRGAMQSSGYDSIVYRNDVEASAGRTLRERMLYEPYQRQIDDLAREYFGERPMRPPLGLKTQNRDRYDRMQNALTEYVDSTRNPPEEYTQRKNRLVQQGGNEIMGKREDSNSLIVLDPDDIRSPDAEFNPDNVEGPGLLRSAMAPTAGAGILGGAMMMGPGEAQAAMQGDGLQTGVNILEGLGRYYGGLGAGLTTGDSDMREGIWDGRSVSPSQGFDALGRLWDQTGAPLAERAIQGVLDYQPPLSGQTIGEQIGGITDYLSEATENWSPEAKERALSGSLLGAELLAGAIPAKRRLTERGGDITNDYRFRVSPTGKPSGPNKQVEREGLLTPQIKMQAHTLAPDQSFDLEGLRGRGVIMAEADRSDNAGIITEINGNKLPIPVNMQGGQGYPQLYPGAAWGNQKSPAQQIMNTARALEDQTGMPALIAPRRMAPGSIDFQSNMGELMMSNAMASGGDLRRVMDKEIQSVVPEWPGLGNPEEAMQVYRNTTGAQKKAIKGLLHSHVSDTGVGIGEARLALTDPEQLNAPTYGLQNIMEVDANQDIRRGQHNTFQYDIPGRYLGRLNEEVTVPMLIPELLRHGENQVHRALYNQTPSRIITDEDMERVYRILNR